MLRGCGQERVVGSRQTTGVQVLLPLHRRFVSPFLEGMPGTSISLPFLSHPQNGSSQMADSTNSMVAIAWEAQLFNTGEEDMGAETDEGVVKRENDAIDINVTSLRMRSAPGLQTAMAALENASDDKMPTAHG